MLSVNCRADGISGHVTGEGPTIVLLHSLLSDRASLEPIVPELKQRFRLLLLDLPGFGGSAPVAGDIAGATDQIEGAIRSFCGEDRPLLFGNGYGSFVALSLALKYPTAVRGLMLAGCGATFSEAGRNAFRLMAEKAKTSGLESIAEVAMRRLFPPAMASKMPDIVAERRESFLRTDISVFGEACHALANLDLSAEAKDLTVPLLACAGEFDEATPPVMAEKLAKLVREGSFQLIANCAHVPTLQAPVDVAGLLQQFAKQV